MPRDVGTGMHMLEMKQDRCSVINHSDTGHQLLPDIQKINVGLTEMALYTS